MSTTTRRCTRSRSPTTTCTPRTPSRRPSICRPASRICSAVRPTTRPKRRPTRAAPRNIRAAGSLSGHTGIPANCVAPTSVTTVNVDPDGAGPLADCRLHGGAVDGARQSRSRRQHDASEFVVAIPIRANTMTWTGTMPTAASDGQAANLDNNSGPETQDGTALTSYGVATGTYSGTLGSGVGPSPGQRVRHHHRPGHHHDEEHRQADVSSGADWSRTRSS